MTKILKVISFFVFAFVLANSNFNFYEKGFAAPRDGLIREYILNGNANDTSGSGSNGTVNNVSWTGTLYSAESGISNTTAKIYNTTNLGINGGNVSISSWIKVLSNHTPSSNDHPIAVGEFSGSPNWVFNGIGFNANNTQVVFSRLKTYVAWNDASYTYSPGIGTWHHYTYTYDGTNIRGYIDGALIVTLAASGNGNPENRLTGASIFGSNNSTNPINQSSIAVQRTLFYNRVLTPAEIQSIYQEGLTPPPPAPTCNDGIKNQNETSIDIGGVCGPAFSPNLNIPRANLAVEYMFNGNTPVDTSGNGNAVNNYNTSFGYNGSGGVNYASFSGTSQIGGLTGWQADPTTGFAVSFWIQTTNSGRTNPSNIGKYCPGFYPIPVLTGYGDTACKNSNGTYNYTLDITEPTVPQILFSSKRIGGLGTDMGLWLTSDYKCNFEENGNSFDCSILKDEKYHNITLRKDDYGTLSVYIDGIFSTLYRSNSSSFGRSVSLGKGVVYTRERRIIADGVANEDTKFIGKIASLRIFRASISDADITSLYNEYPLLKIQTNSAIPVISINNPDTSLTSFKQMSAATSTGLLEMSLTRGDLCGTGLTFEAYTPLTFNNSSDNGQKICYRATNGANIAYKLSNQLTGITSQSSTFVPESIFDDFSYKAWANSVKLKLADFTYPILGAMTGKDNTNYINFVDINGDGLVDVLYNYNGFRSILSNTGDYNFKVSYKCKVANGLYYGDCADLNYK